MKRGFTLLELMFAGAILAVVIGSTGGTVIGLQRLISRAYSEAELSIRMRGLREKILFHAAPPHDGKVFAGILSGVPKSTIAVEGGSKIYLSAGALVMNDGSSSDQTIELVRESAPGGGYCFKNDGETEPWRTRWLRLEGMGEGRTAVANAGYLSGTGSLDDGLLTSVPRRNVFFINLTASLGGVVRSERVTVPVFATEQVKNTESVFHDNITR